MSRPRIEPGPPAWEASILEKSHIDSLFAGYWEPLLGLRLAQRVVSTILIFKGKRIRIT
jgi:hypothetical protein